MTSAVTCRKVYFSPVMQLDGVSVKLPSLNFFFQSSATSQHPIHIRSHQPLGAGGWPWSPEALFDSPDQREGTAGLQCVEAQDAAENPQHTGRALSKDFGGQRFLLPLGNLTLGPPVLFRNPSWGVNSKGPGAGCEPVPSTLALQSSSPMQGLRAGRHTSDLMLGVGRTMPSPRRPR